MKPIPQQVEEDVLVGPFKPPPPNLEVASHRNGLLEDLVILGNLPIAEVIVRDVGLVHQDRRNQLPIGLASTNQEDKSNGYLVHVRVRRSRLEHHPATRWPRNILPSGSHVVAAGQPNPSLTKAVQALDPWDDEDKGDDGVWQEACWLERHMGDIVVEVC